MGQSEWLQLDVLHNFSAVSQLWVGAVQVMYTLVGDGFPPLSTSAASTQTAYRNQVRCSNKVMILIQAKQLLPWMVKAKRGTYLSRNLRTNPTQVWPWINRLSKWGGEMKCNISKTKHTITDRTDVQYPGTMTLQVFC